MDLQNRECCISTDNSIALGSSVHNGESIPSAPTKVSCVDFLITSNNWVICESHIYLNCGVKQKVDVIIAVLNATEQWRKKG